MPATIIEDMPNETYHSHPALSKSTLDELNKSPYHYWLKYLSDTPPPVKWTDAFTVGAALHALVLEPQNFEREFYLPHNEADFDIADSASAYKEACKELGLPLSGTKPELYARIKEAQPELRFECDAEESHEKANAGKIFVTHDQYELCETMTAAIQAHPLAEEYVDGFGKAETSLFWDEGDVYCRARPDYIREDGVIVDVKTALTASPRAWSRKAFDLRYHVQAAMYSRGYEACFGEKPKEFVFVVVEKSYPHCVLVARAGSDFLDAGTIDFERDLITYRQCRDTGHWPSYNADNVLDLQVPSYKRHQYEQPPVKIDADELIGNLGRMMGQGA